MTLPSPFRNFRGLCLLFLLLAAVLGAGGCRKAEIRTYTAPKDDPPEMVWKLPPGWKDEGADQVSFAKFTTPAGGIAMIMPLGRMDEKDAALVNMWRQATGQTPVDDAEAAKTLSPVEIAGDKGKLFEVTGNPAQGEIKVVSAFLHRGPKTWFFNIKGTPAAVDAQKAVFLEFLKSVAFTAPPDPVPPRPDEPGVPGTPPDDWKEVAPGAMQAAKFSVPGKDGTKSEVTVSIFPSDTGGIGANANRWRGQIGLPPADDAALKAAVKPVEGAPEGSVMVEFENAGKSLIGAIVPRTGKWYFYKLTGDSAAVAAARDAFITYCKAGS